MKKKKISKKLSLNKATVSKLNLSEVKGGKMVAGDSNPYGSKCSCLEPTKYCTD